MKLVYSLGMALLVLAACGRNDSTDPAGHRLGTHAYVIVGPDVHARTVQGGLGGTFAMRFAALPPTPNVRVRFVTRIEDTGSLTLATNSSATLEGGIRIRLRRQGNRLFANYAFRSSEMEAANEQEIAGVNAGNDITADIDVHGHGHAWLIINGGAERIFRFAPGVDAPGNLGFVLNRVSKVSAFGFGTSRDD